MIGKVYKITGKGKSYVGSTTKDLKYRLRMHFKDSLKTTGRCDSIFYNFIRENGTEHFIIELVEEYTCETSKELRTREQYWMEQLNPELNTFRATADPNYNQEYREEHKDKMNEYQTKYREKHKEEIKKKKAEKITCECGCKITKYEIIRHQKTKKHKEWIEKH